MDNNINAWEQSGRFYFSDGSIVIETTEMVDVDSLEYDEHSGWIYHGVSLDNITIREV